MIHLAFTQTEPGNPKTTRTVIVDQRNKIPSTAVAIFEEPAWSNDNDTPNFDAIRVVVGILKDCGYPPLVDVAGFWEDPADA